LESDVPIAVKAVAIWLEEVTVEKLVRAAGAILQNGGGRITVGVDVHRG
jgi:hypothetical protein